MGAGDAGGSPPRVGSRRRSSDPNLLRAYALINIQQQRTQGTEQHLLELYLSQRRYSEVIGLAHRIAKDRGSGMDRAGAVAYLLNHDTHMPLPDRTSKRAMRRYVRYLDCMNQCFAVLGQGRLACDFLEEMVAIVMNSHDGWLRFAIVALENGCADMAQTALGNARKLFPEVVMSDAERRQRQHAMDTLLSRLAERRTSTNSEASADTSELTLADSDFSSGGEASSSEEPPPSHVPPANMSAAAPTVAPVRSPVARPPLHMLPPRAGDAAGGAGAGAPQECHASVSPPSGRAPAADDRISALIRKR